MSWKISICWRSRRDFMSFSNEFKISFVQQNSCVFLGSKKWKKNKQHIFIPLCLKYWVGVQLGFLCGWRPGRHVWFSGALKGANPQTHAELGPIWIVPARFLVQTSAMSKEHPGRGRGLHRDKPFRAHCAAVGRAFVTAVVSLSLLCSRVQMEQLSWQPALPSKHSDRS